MKMLVKDLVYNSDKDLENYLQEILDNADLEWRFKADICFCLAGYCEKRAKKEAGD